MPKKAKRPPSDPNQWGAAVVSAITGLPPPTGVALDFLKRHNLPIPPEMLAQEKNPAAVALGRLGGLKGGKARAESLSAKKRSEIAKKAAAARWKKKEPPSHALAMWLGQGVPPEEIERRLGLEPGILSQDLLPRLSVKSKRRRERQRADKVHAPINPATA